MKGNKHIPTQARTRSHGLAQGVYVVLYFVLKASMFSYGSFLQSCMLYLLLIANGVNICIQGIWGISLGTEYFIADEVQGKTREL